MSDSFFLNKVNSTIVPPDLLAEVLERYAAPPVAVDGEILESFMQRRDRLSEICDRRGIEKTVELSIAINLRVAALESLPAEALRGWSVPGNAPGPGFVHLDLVKAAAEEPVIEDGSKQKRLIFNPESFRCRLLEIAQGRA